jgi:hypothetical protein
MGNGINKYPAPILAAIRQKLLLQMAEHARPFCSLSRPFSPSIFFPEAGLPGHNAQGSNIFELWF